MTDKDIFEEKAPDVLADLAKHIETELARTGKVETYRYRNCPNHCEKLGRRVNLYPT